MGENQIFNEFPNLPKKVVDFIIKLIAIITGKDVELAECHSEIAALRAENQALKEQNSLDSHNSSLPPSKDKPGKKPKPKSLRTPSGRKRGGQVGHKGHGIKHLQTRQPDKTVEHWPDDCGGCGNREQCIALGKAVNNQYEYDVLMIPVITKHVIYNVACPLKNGAVLAGTAPLNSTHEYGNGILALCALLYTFGTVSYDRIKELINGLFGLPISKATVYKAVQKCKEGLGDTIEWIREQLRISLLLFLDETGFNIDGVLHWIHTATNGILTYLSVQEKRGEEGMIKAGILNHFKQTGIHDYWKSYYKFIEMIHALCNAHLLRELIERLENTGQEWTKKMIDLLLRIKASKDEIIESGGKAFPEEQWAELKNEYDEIVVEGLALNPMPVRAPGQRGRLKLGKTLCLLIRLRDRSSEILRFATDFNVPFDNNTAERAHRHVKNRIKISGCMRLLDGAQAYCDIMSYLQSLPKHKVNAFDAILAVYNGTSRELIENLHSEAM